jgi:excinuclease UvrABC nuclease subunit
MTEKQIIKIPEIILEWSEWYPWENIKNGIIKVPAQPGVYEAKYIDTDEKLTIGKASNLKMRVQQGLVKGKIPHSAGEKIRSNEDVSKIVVRLATTDRPSAVEEELHKQYKEKFGKLPKYVDHT